MGPRGDTTRLAHRHRSNLQVLLSVGNDVLQQCSRGISPRLITLDLSAAARAATALATQLQPEGPPQELIKLWGVASQDTAAFLALLSVALRESIPCATGDGPGPAYADIRNGYSLHLSRFSRMVNRVWWGRVCYGLLVPVLLRTDTLQCYSRLLAQAADQLKPAAAAALAALQPTSSESQSLSGAPSVAAEAAGEGANSRGQPRTHRGLGEQRDRPRSRPPSLVQLELLLRDVLPLLEQLTSGLQWSTAVGNAPAGHPTLTACAQLHSSWVLEHWAQVLLLGTAVASAEGDGVTKALGVQADMLCALCNLLGNGGLGLTDFLRRPCGCALAATHMAQLCAALDGGDAFGAAKPKNLILPAYLSAERRLAGCADEQAARYDAAAHESKRAVSLLSPAVIVKAWTTLLSEALAGAPDAEVGTPAGVGEATPEALPGGPEDAGSVASSGGRVAAPAQGPGKGLSYGGTAAGVGREGECGASTSGAGQGPAAAAGVSLDKLPPLNRPATFHLCLRLARGVLAQWGAPLHGIWLLADGQVTRRIPPLLPKVSGAVLLHHALACSRLALLPAVWGRERVPRRTRAQLRAWWETYVAAAQHPEALMVALPELPENPAWTREGPRGSTSAGAASWPSADATAAIEAGLLPCLIPLVDRMGLRSSGGVVWWPPDLYPGVAVLWREVLQFGPLGQVGELVSAVGRRLRGAVEQLRAAAAAGERSGTRVGRMGGVLREAMWFARVCVFDLHLGPVYGGFDPDFGERSGPAGVAGAMGAAGRGAVGDGGGDRGGDTHAHAAAGFKRLAVRAAFMLTELLPSLSLAVRMCTELAQQGRGQGPAGTGARRESRAAGPEVGESLVDRAVECAGHALSCTATLMARLYRAATGEQQGARGGGGSSNGGDSGGGGSGATDAEWRQLLLWDVRLMELLGAGVALVQLGATTAAGAGAAGDASAELCNTLAQVLPLAALTFPGEFRAAVGAGAAGASRPGPAAGSHGATGSGGQLEASSCLSLAAIREVLKGICGKDNGPQYKTLAAVLGYGCVPMQQEEMRRLGRLFWEGHESRPEAKAYLVMLPPPGEARAAVAAAAEAAAAATRGPAVG